MEGGIIVLVRLVFQTKWGKAHEVAASFVEGQRMISEQFGEQFSRGRILTDLSGPFHTVVQENEVDSLAEWEQNRGKVFAYPEFQKMQMRLGDAMESGRVEFYNI
jgi:hypothetical protein